MNRIIIYIALVFSIFSCKQNQPKEQESAAEVGKESTLEIVSLSEEQLKNMELSLVQAKEENVQEVFKVNGIIDVPPQNLVSISMPLGGYLKNTKLLPGMHVNKGEVIALMEDAAYIDLQQDFLMAQARLQMLKQEYERQAQLNLSKASSDKVYQQAKEAYENGQIAYKALSEKLQLIGLNPNKVSTQTISRTIPIYAPINGFVSKVHVNIGKYVNPTDILFELVNPEDIHLSLNIFEKDMEQVYMGMQVSAYTNSHPQRKYACEVILIGKDIGSDRSVNVHCHFEEYDKLLVPGTYMNASLLGKPRKAFTLPSDAIISTGSKQYVFVARGKNTFEKWEVKTGLVSNNRTEVIMLNEEATPSGQNFVNAGAYTLWMKLNNVADED
ncbi:MAG: efflux RND transporter periplasmic adaptor subunit [Bacteroidota bacterium]|nr:efflux RND transporter periplasmic adaptor subunit [Bacteroidota bacterium]